jgi:hypothetical protein
MVGATKIGAGVINRETNASTGFSESNLYYLGASHPVGAFTADIQLAKRNAKNSDNDVTMLDAGGTVGVGKTQNGVMAGLRHHF